MTMLDSTVTAVGGGLLSAELARLGAIVQKSTVRIGRRQGAGAGVVLSKDGLIVTNRHVVGRATQVQVEHEGTTLEGQVIARHSSLDLALVQVEATDLPPIEIGSGESLRPGSLAIAVGHPLGFARAVTLGVVVAPVQESMLLTDVTLLPGNSGGPMVDADGRLIGINTLVAGERSFSIAVEAVQELVATATTRPTYLGVTAAPARLPGDAGQTGLALTAIEPGSPAEEAGLLIGDVVIAVGGKPIEDAETLPAALIRAKAGDQLELSLLRGGVAMTVTATLRQAP